ncbi:MAG: hypothetical protein HY706_22115 [Candidatus Hydrogenedentes bacterium]|nr:hypothetical protein [Candidatus Hydrogenedentota bacterium]
MADEPKAAALAAGGTGIVTKLLIWGGTAVVAIVAAGATYQFALAPMLKTEEKPAAPQEVDPNAISPTAATVDFDESFANVIMPDTNMLASLLVFKVSFECSNPETAAIVTVFKTRFNDMITQVHSFRTRQELNDPSVKESIQKQILQKSNDTLKKIQEGQGNVDPKIRITAVFHDRFAVQDQ